MRKAKYTIMMLIALGININAAHAKCYIDSVGEQICVSEPKAKTKKQIRNIEKVGDDRGQRQGVKVTTDEKGQRVVEANYRHVPMATPDETDTVFGALGSTSSSKDLAFPRNKVRPKTPREESQSIAELAEKIETLEKSIAAGIATMEQAGVSAKKIRSATSRVHPEHRRKFDLAVFGLAGIIANPQLFRFGLDGSEYSGMILSGTISSGMITELGGGFKLNAGSERLSFFLNNTFTGMFNSSMGQTINDAQFFWRGQMGVNYAIATSASKNFVLSALVGLESTYHNVNPANLGLHYDDSKMKMVEQTYDQAKASLDKLNSMQITNPRLDGLVESLAAEHKNLELLRSASVSSKMVGAGFMLGLKFTEYIGKRNILAQGIHVSVGPGLWGQNLASASEMGLSLNIGAFFEHSIKLVDSMYLRWFVDAEAIGFLSVTPRMPIDTSSISRLSANVDQFISSVQGSLGVNGKIGGAIAGTTLTGKVIAASVQQAIQDLGKIASGSQPGAMKDLQDALNGLNFGGGIFSILTGVDNLVTSLKNGVKNLPIELTDKAQAITQPLIDLFLGSSSGVVNIAPEVWKVALTAQLKEDLRNSIYNFMSAELEWVYAQRGHFVPSAELRALKEQITNAVYGTDADRANLINMESAAHHSSFFKKGMNGDMLELTNQFLGLDPRSRPSTRPEDAPISQVIKLVPTIVDEIIASHNTPTAALHQVHGINLGPLLEGMIIRTVEHATGGYSGIRDGSILPSIANEFSHLIDKAGTLLDSVKTSNFVAKDFQVHGGIIPRFDFGLGLYWKV